MLKFKDERIQVIEVYEGGLAGEADFRVNGKYVSMTRKEIKALYKASKKAYKARLKSGLGFIHE